MKIETKGRANADGVIVFRDPLPALMMLHKWADQSEILHRTNSRIIEARP